jgi:hypothetical protein
MPRLGLGSSLTGGAVADSALVNSYSLSFDGSNDYVDTSFDLSDDGGITTGDFSISFWMKADTWSSYMCVISNSTYVPQWGGIQFSRVPSDWDGRENDEGALAMLSTAQGSYDQPSAVVTSALSTDTWYHIVGTRASGTRYIYLDGTLQESRGTNSDSIDRGDNLLIGRHPDNTYPRYFDGNIDEVAIWDVALDADAVTAIYNSGTPIALDADSGDYDNSGDLVAYWRFEEGTGTSAADSSTNSNTGTLTNGATWDADVPS